MRPAPQRLRSAAVSESEEVRGPVHAEGQLIGCEVETDVVAVVDESCPFDVVRCARAEFELQTTAKRKPGIVAVEVRVIAVNLSAADTGDRIGRKPGGHGQHAFDIAGVKRIEIDMIALGPALADTGADSALDCQVRIELLTNAKYRHRRRQLRNAILIVKNVSRAGAKIKSAIVGPAAVAVALGHSRRRNQCRQSNCN